jgi:prepilin-type N-terminal cleavage/methylation domain-containing protein
MTRKFGFTLIELLVVIAIIGILAAITFPVFARAKDSAYRSSDSSNMNSIRTALQLYRADQGAYPPTLLGYVTAYSDGSNMGNIMPANALHGALYPKRVDSVATLTPAYNRVAAGNSTTLYDSASIESGAIDWVTTAVWPTIGASPSSDPKAAQRFGPSDGNVFRCVGGNQVTNYYYKVSGYDVADVQSVVGDRTELRYTLFWSGYSVPSTCSPSDATGSASDDTRQLGYTDPPDTTVVTWNSFFRDYKQGVPERNGKRDLVLFLSGAARPYDSKEVADKSWQVMP